ncbi:MAG: BsaA family SipW-dependent biofilm matrix protein [Clostridia bacterium]
MKKNKKLAVILAGVLAVSAVAGSFAYYSETKSIDNTMETNVYGDTLTEVFTPDSNWEPGEEADKIVGVTNTGDYDIVVRIKMSETWTFSETVGDTLTINSDEVNFYVDDAEESKQIDADDGLTDDGNSEPTDYDGSVVYKEFIEELDTYWTYNSADGYYYYNSILESGQSTGALLSSITLCEDTDMGVYETTTYYQVTTSETAPTAAVTDTSWTVLGATDSLADVTVPDGSYLHIRTVSTITEDKEGYAGATYVLTITSETCQATEDAVDETFDDAPTAIVSAWFPTT